MRVYSIRNVMIGKRPWCHPDRQEWALHMCKVCFFRCLKVAYGPLEERVTLQDIERWKKLKRPECHGWLPKHKFNLCGDCAKTYNKLGRGQSFVNSNCDWSERIV
jgi:hypothetical protein